MRNIKITLAKGDTMRSLATKINAYLMFDGKATALPALGGQKLKIEAHDGRKIELIAGADNLDLLAGLGMTGQILIKDPPKDAPDNAAKKTDEKPLIGLALTGKIDLLTKSSAAHTHVVLLAAMAQIKQLYSKLNDPPAANPLPPLSGAAVAQLQNYQAALASFGG